MTFEIFREIGKNGKRLKWKTDDKLNTTILLRNGGISKNRGTA